MAPVHGEALRNTMTPTLVVGGVRPGESNVGELLLRSMIGFVAPGQAVVSAIVPQEAITSEYGSDASILFQTLARRFEYAYRPVGGVVGESIAWLSRVATYERYLKRLVAEVVAWGRSHDAKRLWVILDTPTVIEIAGRVADKLQVPVYSLVWDAPEYLGRLRGLDRLSHARMVRRFGRVLTRSTRAAVVSGAMKSTYETAYGTPCVIVRQGLPSDLRRKSAEAYTDDRQFSIGVAGGLYCASAWKALLEALDHLDWAVASKSIRLVVLGESLRVHSRRAANVQYYGWRTVQDTVDILSGCDVTYLPQPFETSLRDLAELSFPTKLSTYVACGRPVLVHCPDYASLAPFYRGHCMGALCTRLEPDHIAECVQRIAGDLPAYQQAAQCVANLADTEFSQERYRTQFLRFLGLEDR